MGPRLPREGGGPKRCFLGTRELDEWLLPDDGDVHVAAGRLSKCPAYNRLTEIKRGLRGADGSTPQTLEDCTNRQLRVVIYYKIFLDLWANEDRDDKSKREKIPSCIEHEVRSRYPDDAQDMEVKEELSKSQTNIADGNVWDYRYEKTLADYLTMPKKTEEDSDDEQEDSDEEGGQSDDDDEEEYQCTSNGYTLYHES